MPAQSTEVEITMSDELNEHLPERRVWIRSRPVKTMFRPPEHEDLRTIAEAWGVPVATAVWAIVAGELARWRREAPNYGEAGLAIAAAMSVKTPSMKKEYCALFPGETTR